MAGRYNHVSYLGNYNGEHPPIPPSLNHTPTDEAWLAEFLRPKSPGPAIVCERGTPSILTGTRAYYRADDGQWRDTLTDDLWSAK